MDFMPLCQVMLLWNYIEEYLGHFDGEQLSLKCEPTQTKPYPLHADRTCLFFIPVVFITSMLCSANPIHMHVNILLFFKHVNRKGPDRNYTRETIQSGHSLGAFTFTSSSLILNLTD
jgi:hypothetical protein